jgi:hypothetical protein
MERDMQERDLEIDRRLAAIAARAPGGGDPPALPRRNHRGRFALSLTMAPVLALALVATVAAGAVVVTNMAQGHPGIENPGQPLAGARLECMSPPQAAAYLAAHGYPNVAWQVESGDGSKAGGTSIQQSTPPEHGYVIPGSVLEDGLLHLVIDQRVGATGVGACVDTPMP